MGCLGSLHLTYLPISDSPSGRYPESRVGDLESWMWQIERGWTFLLADVSSWQIHVWAGDLYTWMNLILLWCDSLRPTDSTFRMNWLVQMFKDFRVIYSDDFAPDCLSCHQHSWSCTWVACWGFLVVKTPSFKTVQKRPPWLRWHHREKWEVEGSICF